MTRTLLIGLLISLLFVAALLYGLEWRSFWIGLRQARYSYLLPAAVLVVALMYLRALRWRYLMAPIKAIPFGSLASATFIGFMANNLLPARLGEIIRAVFIGWKEGVSKSASLATIVVERLFDGMAILLLLLGLLIFPPKALGELGGTLQIVGGVSFMIYLILLGLLLLAYTRQSAALRWGERFCRPLPARWRSLLVRLLGTFLAGLGVLHQGHALLVVTAYSLLHWTLAVAPVYLLFLAFDLQLPVGAAVLVLVLVAFGVMIPSSPGYVGTFHAATVAALAIYAVPRETALGFAVLLHAVSILPVTLLGLGYLWREGLSWRQVTGLARKEAGA